MKTVEIRTSPRPRILVTHLIHDQVLRLLKKHFSVDHNATGRGLSRRALLRKLRTADGVISFMPDIIDKEFLDAAPHLKIITAALKGFDNIDVDEIVRRKIVLKISRSLLTKPTAELILALMLGISRNIFAGNSLVRQHRFKTWLPRLYGNSLEGKTAGIIGMGMIGWQLARSLRSLGMHVIYCDNGQIPNSRSNGTKVDLNQLLREADYVIPLTPLTRATYHMIGKEQVGKMKLGAYIINAGRGSLVDEAAISVALRSGKLEGYAADVFEMEDFSVTGHPKEINKYLLTSEKTLLTPHLGSAVKEVRLSIEMEAAENLVRFFKRSTILRR
ncbi:MAG TPA: NAD(P)-dependent oxidoreductase [Cyclobacteriaceae bacterium]|nr:NAD(P)-dependent oxidoreductase [Cyclobacteriaceae bacterium]